MKRLAASALAVALLGACSLGPVPDYSANESPQLGFDPVATYCETSKRLLEAYERRRNESNLSREEAYRLNYNEARLLRQRREYSCPI